MKRFLALLFIPTAATALFGAPAPDLALVSNAVTVYRTEVESLGKEIASAQTPEGAAKVINALADATTRVAVVISAVPRQHPELVKSSAPPPELVPASAALQELITKLGPIGVTIKAMKERYSTNPQFAVAVLALEKSFEGMRNLGPSQSLQLAGSVFRELKAVDIAIDMWAIAQAKREGDLPTVADLATYLPAGGKLRESASRGQLFDSLGNPIAINRLGQPPTVSPQSVQSFANVVPVEFWQPYVARANAPGRL